MPIEITMPALSPTMTEGNLTKWHKKEGEKIKAGDVIAEIETDKATMEVEAVDSGVMGRIMVSDGTQGVPVNSVIALLLEEGEDKGSLASYKAKEQISESRKQKSDEEKELKDGVSPHAYGGDKGGVSDQRSGENRISLLTSPSINKAPLLSGNVPSTGNRVKSSPLARKLAENAGIDITSLIGSGPDGRIVKADVESAVAGGGRSSAIRRNMAEFIHIPNSGMRKVIAKRLLESKQQVPHFYLSIDCELDNLLEVRQHLNDRANGIYKLSVNDFIIKAVAMALKNVPEANASWYDDAIVQYNNVDVSVAVAIDGGLITPIVRNADQKTLPTISHEMKELASRAKKGALKPEEYQGGGFTISNLGMYGIKEFSAIINPPQACILAIGKGEERAIVTSGELTIANVMTVTLSVDHRAVDGAVGANFLAEFKKYIEQPVTMFV